MYEQTREDKTKGEDGMGRAGQAETQRCPYPVELSPSSIMQENRVRHVVLFKTFASYSPRSKIPDATGTLFIGRGHFKKEKFIYFHIIM